MSGTALRMPVNVGTIPLTPDMVRAMQGERALNRAQAVAACFEGKLLLVIGPPGTGKTTTLVQRILWLLDNGVSPNEIICGTYAVEAAGQIVRRLKEMGRDLSALDGYPNIKKPWLYFSSLNKIGYMLLRRFAAKFPQEIGFELRPGNPILSGQRQIAFIKSLDIDLGKRAKRGGGEGGETGTAARKPLTAGKWFGGGFGAAESLHFGDGPNKLEDLTGEKQPASLVLGRVDGRSFLDIITDWEQRLIFPADAIRIANGDNGRLIGNDDLLRRAKDYKKYKDALREEKYCDLSEQTALPVQILRTSERARKAISGFRHLLVDEYNDVNTANGALIDAMAGGDPMAPPATGTGMTLWAVGDPDQTLYSFRGSDPSFILTFQDRLPGAEVIALTDNYRSRPPIIAAANQLIRNNRERYATELNACRPNENLPPAIGKALITPNRYLTPDTVRPVAIEVTRYPSDRIEARDLAGKVRRLIDANVPAREIAILCRASFRTFFVVHALRGAGVKIRILRSEANEQEEATLVEGLLRGVRFRPGFDDGDTILKLLGVEENQKKLTPQIKEWQEAGLTAPDRWHDLVAEVEDLVCELGRKNNGKGDDTIPDRWRQRVEAVCDAARQHPTFDSWADCAAVFGKEEKGGEDGRTDVLVATLATIHATKGLEFDYVFLPGCEIDICPDNKDMANEEERRLFYVALTRAREALTASHALLRAGSRGESEPSPYLAEAFHGVPSVAWVQYADPEDDVGLEPTTAGAVAPKKPKTERAAPPPSENALAALGGGAAGKGGEGGSSWDAPKKPAGAETESATPERDGRPAELVTPPIAAVVQPQATKTADKADDKKPPPGGSEQPLRSTLTVSGGEGNQMAVWRIILKLDDGGVLFDRLVYPNSDFFALDDAVKHGFSQQALREAERLDQVVEALREHVAKLVNVGLALRVVAQESDIQELGLEEWDVLL